MRAIPGGRYDGSESAAKMGNGAKYDRPMQRRRYFKRSPNSLLETLFEVFRGAGQMV
jgi:hypothetical protein